MVKMSQITDFVDSTELLGSPQELRDRAQKDGALFFKGLLSPDSVNGLRAKILEVCRRNGLLNPGAPLMQGVAQDGIRIYEGQSSAWRQYYNEVLKIRELHALALHSRLVQAMEVLLGEAVLTHSRNICRTTFPDSASFTTPPHQDFFYIGGTANTWTAWVPCGDCPEDLGGLALIPGSHRWGFLKVKPAQGAGGNQVDVPPDAAWMSGDFSCGDVLLFHSHTVHQGRDNQTSNRLRISLDYRYQAMSDPVRSSSMEPHLNWLSWEDVYKGWDPDDPLKHYWRDWPLRRVAD